MPVRYKNDKNLLLKSLENDQGRTLFPKNVYVHTDEHGFKRVYILKLWHRVFMFFEDPKSSILGSYFGTFMLLVIAFNLTVFIISSLSAFKEVSSSCSVPACDHDPVLCSDRMICEPQPKPWTQTAEMVCVIIFTIEYVIRILLVWTIPPRLSDVLVRRKDTTILMNNLFTSKKPCAKEELFAHIKAALGQTQAEIEKIKKISQRNKSIIYNNNDELIGMDIKLPNADDDLDMSVRGIRTDTSDGRGLDVPLDELRPVKHRLSMGGAPIEDDGYELPGMNAPVTLHDNSSLVETSTPPRPRSTLSTEHPSESKKRKRKNYKFAVTDTLAELHRKSLGMDKSHHYSGVYKTWVYFKKILNLIDLVAIIPFYIETYVLQSDSSSGISMVRILRLARVFRIFKMGKGNAGVIMLAKTLYVSMPQLSLLAFFIVLALILFGAILFYLEGGSFQVTEDYPNGAYLIPGFFGIPTLTEFHSIVSSIYFAVVVTTTTGYGDLVPVTFTGKLLACFCAYYGVLLLALPITVIGTNFDKILNSQSGKDNEVFIYECLVGVTRALDVEFRARARMAPPPSSAYKMTMISAIISTFDPTKQSLLKDAIMHANRAAVRQHQAEEDLRLLRQSDASLNDESTVINSTESNMSADLPSFTTCSPSTPQSEKKIGHPSLLDRESQKGVANDIKDKKETDGHVHSDGSSNEPGIQPSIIVWDKIAKVPDKHDLQAWTDLAQPTDRSPAEELRSATEELNSAIAEWQALFK